jgi:hypothetical protein
LGIKVMYAIIDLAGMFPGLKRSAIISWISSPVKSQSSHHLGLQNNGLQSLFSLSMLAEKRLVESTKKKMKHHN